MARRPRRPRPPSRGDTARGRRAPGQRGSPRQARPASGGATAAGIRSTPPISRRTPTRSGLEPERRIRHAVVQPPHPGVVARSFGELSVCSPAEPTSSSLRPGAPALERFAARPVAGLCQGAQSEWMQKRYARIAGIDRIREALLERAMILAPNLHVPGGTVDRRRRGRARESPGAHPGRAALTRECAALTTGARQDAAKLQAGQFSAEGGLLLGRGGVVP